MSTVPRLTQNQLSARDPLTPEQITLLADAIAKAFLDHNGLSDALVRGYGASLAELVSPALSLPQASTELVRVASKAGRIRQLLIATRTAVSGNRNLQDAENVLLGAADASDTFNTKLSTGRLPIPANPDLFIDRTKERELLDRAWRQRSPCIIQFVADGGVGKSMIIWTWLEALREQGYPGCSQVFDWSFYSQGHRDYVTDSRKFLMEANWHFRQESEELIDDLDDRLGRRIGNAFLETGGILILDGVEPLQYPPDVNGGALKDAGLAGFIRQVRGAPPPRPEGSPRLLIVTTRWGLPELRASRTGSICKVDLNYLSDEDGAKLLRDFESPNSRKHLYYVPGSSDDREERIEAEFQKASREYGGHALALVLLASYLLEQHGGDLSKRGDVDPVPEGGDDDPYRHARRVMRSYDRLFRADGSALSQACRQVLNLIGLFDRPAPSELVAVLRSAALPGLTDLLRDDHVFNEAVSELRKLRILAQGKDLIATPLDTHPLVREHFGRELRRDRPTWLAANSLLFDELRQAPASDQPDTLSDLEPLFLAVPHGCKAERYHEAYELYVHRIMRGNQRYAAEKLGALGPLVSLLSHFFADGEWGKRIEPAPDRQTYDEEQFLTLLMQSGDFLTATRGYAAPAVKACYAPALDICQRMTPPDERLTQAQYGLWRYYLVHDDLKEASELAQTILSSATTGPGDARAALAAHRAVCSTEFYRGNFAQAIKHGDLGIEVFEAVPKPVNALFHEMYITCVSYGALSLWMLGDKQRAIVRSGVSITAADAEEYAHGRAISRFFDILLAIFRGDYKRVEDVSQELVAVSAANGLSLWLAAGVIAQGKATFELSNPQDGLDDMYRGLEDWEHTGALLVMPFWEWLLADSLTKKNDKETARQLVDRAVNRIHLSGERWWLPRLLELRKQLS